MLTIRGTQFDTLVTARLDAARQGIVAMMWRRREEFAGRVELAYVEEMVAFAVDQCVRHELKGLATWSGFAESLLKDDVHPMPADRRASKSESILRAHAAQSLFSTLKALEAATAASGGAAQPDSDR